jgi:hypothetical protein
MTLGGAAAARVRFIVWCRDCRHQGEPDPAEMANRYGPETTGADWRKRLVCSRCASHDMDRSLRWRADPISRPPIMAATVSCRCRSREKCAVTALSQFPAVDRQVSEVRVRKSNQRGGTARIRWHNPLHRGHVRTGGRDDPASALLMVCIVITSARVLIGSAFV